MNWPTFFSTTICSLALVSLLSLGSVAPALAAPVTDRFDLNVTIKEFCDLQPKFFSVDKAAGASAVLLTITRDVDNNGDFTDISAAIGLGGGEPDVIPMKGRMFPTNKSGTKAEFALSGVNPGNADHFITVRGQATFDKLGQMINLIKVTGTIQFQITDTYSIDKVDTQSAPAKCFGSGTFSTGKKNTSFGGGTLTVTGAPLSVGGTFVVDPPRNQTTKLIRTIPLIKWGEAPVASPFHNELLAVAFDPTRNLVVVVFALFEGPGLITHWDCTFSCAGVTIDKTAGTAVFTNTVLTVADTTSTTPVQPITVNGTVHFTPF